MEHLGGGGKRCHIDEGALKYAKNKFNITSMVDIGCGIGGMLALANKHNISYKGIDGDPELAMPSPNFIVHDFRNKFDKELNNIDLAWSVEFLEHVEEEYMENYLAVFRKAKYIICTAAPPGKKGWHHVNCQPVKYWINIFEKEGFKFSEKHTKEMKRSSTMKREFMKKTGMVFINEKID